MNYGRGGANLTSDGEIILIIHIWNGDGAAFAYYASIEFAQTSDIDYKLRGYNDAINKSDLCINRGKVNIYE